ncbi:hypothetical protein [Bradyrhizobium brasilense]|uniref:Uncharacterized protein n=1 Tax=Bradyrhizobium brasilense TaxID=1419277 RepID=A0ABY8J9Z8_9BRAD|nr:hypothetical protein [Bradyrhizobium brasilense]WFU62390.1 hypothetical protein QA636_33580 [Bradyrhizobium brasilense]
MYGYVTRANIDRYLNVLYSTDLTSHERQTVTRLLLGEFDKLRHDPAQLEFVETRAANGRERVNHARRLRESYALGTIEREESDRLLVDVESLQSLLDAFIVACTSSRGI